MTLEVCGNRVFMPAPVGQRARIEFQPAALSGEAAHNFIANLHSGQAPAIFIALIAGVVVGAAVIARKGAKEGRKTAVPFGPFLALGGVIAFFAGADLVDAYLDTF